LDSEEHPQILPSPPPAAQALGFFQALVIGLLCFGVAVGVRLISVRTSAPNADEHHWVTRSAILAERIRIGDYREATSHLGHPGIPAAAAMAVAEQLAAAHNARRHAEPFSNSYIDPLAAARIGNVLLSSSIFPLLFWAASPLLGPLAALCATLLLVFDYQHVALSRIAHIDGVLTLLAAACLLLYTWAERRSSTAGKVLAGVIWGLAIATKPTAAALVGVFFCYKVLRRLFCSSYLPQPPALLSWAEIWAVFAGHVVLGSLYTKLWDPQNTYLTKHNIRPALAPFISSLSSTLNWQPFLPALLGLSVFLVALHLLIGDDRRSRRLFHLEMTYLLAGVLVLCCWEFPVVCINLLRFWYWVAGLSHRNHTAYGMVWKEPGTGYTEIWFRRLPSLVIFGTIAGLPFLFRRLRQRSSLEESETVCMLLLFLCAAVLWTLPLSISSKQTVRYIVPAFPFVFLFAGWGLWQAAAYVSSRLGVLNSSRILGTPLSIFLLLASAVGLQGTALLSSRKGAPNVFNFVSGGPRAALRRGFVLSPVGYNSALRTVQAIGAANHDPQYLEVLGDYDLMKFAYSRLMPKTQRTYMILRPFERGSGSDWLLEFPAFTRRKGIDLSNRAVFEPYQQLLDHGAPVYTLYRVHPPDYRTPVVLKLSEGARRMGHIQELSEEEDALEAAPDYAGPGYIHFNQYLRLHAGTYTLRYPVSTLPASAAAQADPDSPLLRLDLSTQCSRNVNVREVLGAQPALVELTCRFPTETRAQVSIYWYGTVAVQVRNPSVQRID
jgi:hypothetical protein